MHKLIKDLGVLDRIKNVFVPQKEEIRHDQRSLQVVPAYGSAVGVDSDKALTFTAVWAAIRLLSESVASLPISVYKIDKNGDKIEDVANPIYTLLKYKPNNYQNKITFFELLMMNLCTKGESFFIIQRNNRSALPQQLMPVSNDSVDVIQDMGSLFYEIDGVTYDADQVLHFKTLTSDGIRGISPIDQCKSSIGWGMALEEFGNTFFKNGAKLSGVLQTDRQLSETAVERLKQSFNNVYAKLSNSNQTMVLEEGLSFKPISITAEQAQFLASRTFSVEEIARIFNIPPHMLKDLSKSSFNNIEMQSQEFVTYTLMPYLTRIEQEMNLKLFRTNELGKSFVKFNVNGLLRGNTKDRAEFYRTMLNIGAMSINEVRSKENMNKIEGGDKHVMQMNMTTIEKIGEDESVG